MKLESEKEKDHVLLINNAGEHSIAVFVEICPTYSRFCIQISNVSLCFQPLWVTSPSFQVSLTWMWWTPTCPSILARLWRWPQECCRFSRADRACDGLWWTSPQCSQQRRYRPGCCTALPKQPERWCSVCWQWESQMSESSATLQVFTTTLYND